MATSTDQETVPDTTMEDATPQEQVEGPKPTYKSFKKKYRKMRIKFEEVMRESNENYTKEQRAIETGRRLACENDQLLDLLLDVNNSAQIPNDKRINLYAEHPALAPIPPLITADDNARAAELHTPEGQALCTAILNLNEEREATNNLSKSSKSLALLMTLQPHLSLSTPGLPADLLSSLEPEAGQPAPISYLTPDQLDDYLYDIDASLGRAPPHPAGPPHKESPTSHDATSLGNPNSVYNWLRKNEPKIFLQDGEGSEKSLGKPGALRGAGKRASIPAPSKPDQLEIVEEDGMTYDTSLTGTATTKGKRKRDEDDGGYHPKNSRNEEGKVKKPRKKKESSGEGASATKVSKRKTKAKIPSPDPGAHPFGPL